MSDLISRADAMAEFREWVKRANENGETPTWNDAVSLIGSLPSADAVNVAHDIPEYCRWSQTYTNMVQSAMSKASADAVPTVIRAKTFMRKEDFDKWAEDIKKQNKSIVCIPCDAEVVSADAVQGEWIPCGEKMPKELERVNVTWLNHDPPFYYQHIKDIPQTDTAVYYRGKWYWWDATLIDVLAEYGEDCNAEQIDKDIEILAWMPLPTPYKGGEDK